MANISQVILGVFIVHKLLSMNTVHCYVCSTPTKWLDKVEEGGYLTTGIGGIWPGGVVKYQLNSTLTEKDKQEVFLAFDEFNKKTCIRFEPYSTGDYNYVSIEVDNSVCGMAHVCMKGGYQFAKFGQNCRTKNNMIHQLSHTICLSHEEDHRYDGDQFITFDKSCSSSTPQWQNALVSRIYDQASQMHFGCDSENKCGYQITAGLSVLDADYINALYNCQGCYRHRWIPKPTLSFTDTSTIYSFGFNDLGGGAISPCRAFFKGEVSIGKYNREEGTCYIGFEDKEYKLCGQFEVLTIPGGVRGNFTEYLLAEAYQGMSVKKENALFKNAVVAGRLPWADGSSSYGHGYVAFGAVPNFQKSCAYGTNWWNGGANRKLDVIGRAWRYKNGTRAFAALCKLEFSLRIFYVLSCKPRESRPDEDWEVDNNSGSIQDVQINNDGSLPQERIKMALQQQQYDQQSNYFLPGFITGFLVFAALLAILVGIVYFGNNPHKFGFPVQYKQDFFFEE